MSLRFVPFILLVLGCGPVIALFYAVKLFSSALLTVLGDDVAPTMQELSDLPREDAE